MEVQILINSIISVSLFRPIITAEFSRSISTEYPWKLVFKNSITILVTLFLISR